MRPLLEVCVDSIGAALAAIEGGCDRLEVCSSLASGGLTPSCGLLQTIRNKHPDIPLFAMIRPRPGDFCYSPQEVEQMRNEIDSIRQNSLANGFVFGLLLKDGTIDEENCKLLLEACGPHPATFHRAFDVCSDPFPALEAITELGFSRVLTSGQQMNAENGIEVLRMLVEKANNRVIIIPGCGVNHMNVETILRETKAKEFHTSASMAANSLMDFRKETISMGRENGSEYAWSTCDARRVRCMLEIAKRFQV